MKKTLNCYNDLQVFIFLFFIMNFQKLRQNKSFFYTLITLGLGFILFIVVFIFNATIENMKQNTANRVNQMISNFSYDSCNLLFLENLDHLKENKYVNYVNLKSFYDSCKNDFDLSLIDINKTNCEKIISSNNS